jgi:hypothetical protein
MNDIQELESEIRAVEKDYNQKISFVSRAPQYMTTVEFMGLLDSKRRQLIKEEIDYYCERDNKVSALRKQIIEIRQANRQNQEGM